MQDGFGLELSFPSEIPAEPEGNVRPRPDLGRLRHETQARWNHLRELPPLRAVLHGIPGLDLPVVD